MLSSCGGERIKASLDEAARICSAARFEAFDDEIKRNRHSARIAPHWLSPLTSCLRSASPTARSLQKLTESGLDILVEPKRCNC